MFQSTPPRRRATIARNDGEHDSDSVSIHAPPEEGDLPIQVDLTRPIVSIHAPPEEGDRSG